MAATSLTLQQRLLIGLVPSFIPALVLIVALGMAVAIGELPEALGNAFEQLAGGALLITYMKELLPRMMEMGSVAVHTRSDGKSPKYIAQTKVLATALMIFWMSVSAVLQSAADGFPGLLPAVPGEGSTKEAFTPAATIAFFIGFFVDGVCLAYDDDPVRFDKTLVKKMMFSLVFSIDNFLDGFGLVPVLKEAFGGSLWWTVMLAFSACVLGGAVCTACLRYFFPSPMFHLCFLSFATTSILVGALQLCSHGVSVWVMLGIAVVWMVLFVGDLLGEEEEEEEEKPADAEAVSAPPPLETVTSEASVMAVSLVAATSLQSKTLMSFKKVALLKGAAIRAKARVSGEAPTGSTASSATATRPGPALQESLIASS